jgi:stringent starvation protein B
MMTSNKPYLIRALYEWLVDNDATPYIMVDTTQPGVMIPPGIDRDGQVVLNIAMRAVQGLDLANGQVTFSARFSGATHNIYIPMRAVMAIYSKEDGEGMMFAEDSTESVEQPGNAPLASAEVSKTELKSVEKPNKPGLKIVK